jgi:hypothetical protein
MLLLQFFANKVSHIVSSKYSVSTDLQNWGQARVACKKLGMDLVTIETEEENTCVKEKIQLAGETFC